MGRLIIWWPGLSLIVTTTRRLTSWLIVVAARLVLLWVVHRMLILLQLGQITRLILRLQVLKWWRVLLLRRMLAVLLWWLSVIVIDWFLTLISIISSDVSTIIVFLREGLLKVLRWAIVLLPCRLLWWVDWLFDPRIGHLLVLRLELVMLRIILRSLEAMTLKVLRVLLLSIELVFDIVILLAEVLLFLVQHWDSVCVLEWASLSARRLLLLAWITIAALRRRLLWHERRLLLVDVSLLLSGCYITELILACIWSLWTRHLWAKILHRLVEWLGIEWALLGLSRLNSLHLGVSLRKVWTLLL